MFSYLKLKFFGGATSLDSFFKTKDISKTKGFFRYEWLDQLERMQTTELPPLDAFHSKQRNHNPLEAQCREYDNILRNGSTTEQVVIKLKLSKPPPTEIENYHCLHEFWMWE